MEFRTGYEVTLLWEWWVITTKLQYALAFVVVVCMGVGRRFLVRAGSEREPKPKRASDMRANPPCPRAGLAIIRIVG